MISHTPAEDVADSTKLSNDALDKATFVIHKLIDGKEKATALIVKLMDKKDKLCIERNLLKEKIIGLAKVQDDRKALPQDATAIVVELMDEKEKINIERNLLMAESITPLKQLHEDIKEIIGARVEKDKAMDAVKKMAEGRQEEMMLVVALKKKIEELLADQPIINVAVKIEYSIHPYNCKGLLNLPSR